MGEFSITHLLLLLGIVLIFFGPSRLPSLGASMGKAIRGFKDGMKGTETPQKDAETHDRIPSSREAQLLLPEEKEKSRTNQNS